MLKNSLKASILIFLLLTSCKPAQQKLAAVDDDQMDPSVFEKIQVNILTASKREAYLKKYPETKKAVENFDKVLNPTERQRQDLYALLTLEILPWVLQKCTGSRSCFQKASADIKNDPKAFFESLPPDMRIKLLGSIKQMAEAKFKADRKTASEAVALPQPAN